MTQAINRHKARSQFREPMWSMPGEILSALLLQRQEKKHKDDASLSFSEQWCITKRRLGGLKTHSQNSMTGEVAFRSIVWLFLLWISTQFSEGEKKGQNVKILKRIKNTGGTSDAFWRTFVTCVPCVVAGRPGQVPGEGERQVENPPGQNDDVVKVQESHDHLGSIAKTCRNDIFCKKKTHQQNQWRHFPAQQNSIFSASVSSFSITAS